MLYDINNRPTLLQEGDTVLFELKNGKILYRVVYRYLDNREGSNEEIFRRLGISKFDAAREAYEYNASSGDWPEFNDDDYEAATRLVNALFDRIAALPEGETKDPAPLGYVTFTPNHFAVVKGGAEAGKVYRLVRKTGDDFWTEPLPGYSEGIVVRSALVDGTAILTDKDGNPIENHAKIAQLQHQIEAQAGAIGRMTRKINRQRLELQRFHDLEEMRKRLPKPSPITLDDFFAQLGIPSEFHELVREMLADLHKVRTVQVGYVAKSGEHFESGAGIGILRGGETSDALALSLLFQDSARRMIEESHI